MATLRTDSVLQATAGGATDALLPAQYPGGSFDAALQPEKRLMLAVLEDAVATLRRYAGGRTPRERRLLAETWAWCGSNDTAWPFAYVNVCHAVGLDVQYVRDGLRRMLEREQRVDGDPTTFVPGVFRRVCGSRTRVTELRYSA